MTQLYLRKCARPFLLFFMLFAHITVFALPSDKEKPLNIVADSVTVSYAKNVTVLEGSVVVTQGSTKLYGNKVIVYTDTQQQLVKLIAYGNANQQARYETQPTPKSSPFQATANTITYLGTKKLAIFEGKAHATDGINQFDGPMFKYWTERQEVITEKINNQRSSIIIYPGSHHS